MYHIELTRGFVVIGMTAFEGAGVSRWLSRGERAAGVHTMVRGAGTLLKKGASVTYVIAP